MRPLLVPCTFLISVSLWLIGCGLLLHGTTDTVTIMSTGQDSRIYVDDKLVGTDDAIVEVSRGEIHRIRVVKEGCKNQSART